METIEYIGNSAVGVGIATIAKDGTVLDTWYPTARLCDDVTRTATRHLSNGEAIELLGKRAEAGLADDPRRDVRMVTVETTIANLGEPPVDLHDLYLRLHLLSMRHVLPRRANLDGLLALANDVAWTSIGPCKPERLDELLWIGRSQGTLIELRGVFKVPRMLDYVVPTDVWVADSNRVLLGAYLAPGTLVMPEGFCGVNAGTLGPCMVEGRISLGVVVGAGSDIGGGASIMGTTSGGGKQIVTIGEGCLLGANSGIGISLGDNCVVEAGLYLTAGTRVLLPGGESVKALELAGQSNLLFRRNSLSGAVEALVQTKPRDWLNVALHAPSSRPTLLQI
jgi:2,3,4,5-tetrahydropyridine-2-carboxylate N-succinyltransferase